MSTPEFVTLGSSEGLADVLTASDPVTRCSGRALASDWPRALQQWVEAEVTRGTKIDVLLTALFNMQVQIAAGVVGNVISVGGHEVALQNFRKIVDGQFLKHAKITRQFCEAAR
ncbi:hypothetical protein [Mesorhizobium sp. M1399]|uniref:hypothetical protein n=1 Tax=Mesorhizobium sp. M1399 TaxID=2957096 RepID=UPI0033360F77